MRSPRPLQTREPLLAVVAGVLPTVLIASVLAAVIFGGGGRALRIVVAAVALAVFLMLPRAVLREPASPGPASPDPVSPGPVSPDPVSPDPVSRGKGERRE